MKHNKIYFDHFGYDFTPCEKCGKPAVDIHHIENKGMGGSKTKDYIENLIALCRDCHSWAHNPNTRQKQEELKEIHQNYKKIIDSKKGL